MAEDPIHGPYPDAHVAALARLFSEHPAWRRAATRISANSESSVYFSHRPHEAWHLSKHASHSTLRPGPSSDPDFVFRFSPGSIAVLQAASGEVGDFALALFLLLDSDDADHRVDLRIAAPFARLRKRGYLGLLLGAGPRVLALGARRGIRSLSTLKRLVDRAGSDHKCEWESPAPQSSDCSSQKP